MNPPVLCLNRRSLAYIAIALDHGLSNTTFARKVVDTVSGVYPRFGIENKLRTPSPGGLYGDYYALVPAFFTTVDRSRNGEPVEPKRITHVLRGRNETRQGVEQCPKKHSSYRFLPALGWSLAATPSVNRLLGAAQSVLVRRSSPAIVRCKVLRSAQRATWPTANCTPTNATDLSSKHPPYLKGRMCRTRAAFRVLRPAAQPIKHHQKRTTDVR